MLTRRKRNAENTCRENSSSPPKINKNKINSNRRSSSAQSKERCPFNNITHKNNLNEVYSSNVPEIIKTPRKSPRKLSTIGSPSTLISRLNIKSPTKENIENVDNICQNAFKDYAALRSAFATCGTQHFVGREEEISALENFLTEHLENSLPGSLYVSGAPGTGKTASITNILNDMDNLKIKQVFINCMTKKCAKEIFSEIASQLQIKTTSSGERDLIKKIEHKLTASKIPILIILDEIDQLESKDQNVLYTIFEWPSLAQSKLVLLGIANMLDLTDRILPRLQANPLFKPDLIQFPPYTKQEIIAIIKSRIEEANITSDIIKPSAIHFLAGKVSAVAGDARKALDVCRRGVEMCEVSTKRQLKINDNATPKPVDIPLLMSIFNDIYGSKVTDEIKDNPNAFPLQQKVLLCALLLILKHSKSKDVNLGKFHEVYSRVCNRQNLPSVEQGEFSSLCSLLESRGILQLKKSKELRNSKVVLRLNEDEATEALGDKVLLANIVEDKSCLTSR